MDDLRHESEGAARIFKNKMMEMNANREVKVEANGRIIAEVEVQIVSALKMAGQRLTEVK